MASIFDDRMADHLVEEGRHAVDGGAQRAFGVALDVLARHLRRDLHMSPHTILPRTIRTHAHTHHTIRTHTHTHTYAHTHTILPRTIRTHTHTHHTIRTHTHTHHTHTLHAHTTRTHHTHMHTTCSGGWLFCQARNINSGRETSWLRITRSACRPQTDWSCTPGVQMATESPAYHPGGTHDHRHHPGGTY